MQFTGSESLFQHSLIGHIRYTEGVQYVADVAGAYWLIDEVTLNQLNQTVAAEPFQHWKLIVDLGRHSAVLTCDDGNDVVVFTKRIEFTDFLLDEIRFYFVGNTIMLPSEY
jgi:hypothetical protein